MVLIIYYQDMNTKPNQIKLQEYNRAIQDLQILDPVSEHASFKQIFSGTSSNSRLSKDTRAYIALRSKIAQITPEIVKKTSKRSLGAIGRATKKVGGDKPFYKSLTDQEINTQLNEKNHKAVVSIIVPVYNNLDYTKKCLVSLANQDSKYGFNVIIADDQSTDQTEHYCKALSSIKYKRNSENLGFLLSCNASAANVKSQYIVLLNNDTEVLEGWLDNLIDPLEKDETVGLVGSKLVYPDGTLQEAGGIVFSDGNAWNYGKNEAPNDFEYNYMREVDYVSGASIAFRTDTFKDLGGFDKTFAPAYYEDTDLAMQMRKIGLKVIYNPASSIIHYEGKSMGTDTQSGLKAYQRINKEKFYKKWQKVLVESHYPGPDYLLWARERGVKQNILVCDIHVPFPDRDAGSVRMHAILTCLREIGHHVTFWPDTHCPLDHYTKDLQAKGVEVEYGTKSFEEFIRERAGYYDHVILSRPIVAPRYLPLIKHYSPQAKIIFDTVDLHYIRLGRQAKIENNSELEAQSKKWKIIELGLIDQADTSLVVSSFEKTELEKVDPTQRVEIVSLIHELREKPASNFSKRKGVMFIGSYSHLPNKDGLIWFVENVWPLILRAEPKLSFTIIGSNMPTDLFAQEKASVKVLGFVEDPSDNFESSRVFVAPLRFGAGIKGKILQSIEYGLPVVTTSVGAEGMFLEDNKTAMIADDPEDFAKKLLEIYTNKTLWENVSRQSQKVLTDHFSRDVAKKELFKIIE